MLDYFALSHGNLENSLPPHSLMLPLTTNEVSCLHPANPEVIFFVLNEGDYHDPCQRPNTLATNQRPTQHTCSTTKDVDLGIRQPCNDLVLVHHERRHHPRV